MNSKDTVAILLALDVLLRRRACTTLTERKAVDAIAAALAGHQIKRELAPPPFALCGQCDIPEVCKRQRMCYRHRRTHPRDREAN